MTPAPGASATAVAPYGSWPSPIAAARTAAGAVRIDEIAVDVTGALWWNEGRPAEGGRTAVCRRSVDGVVAEVSPPDANVRSRVHEYGGGAWLPTPEVLFAVDGRDQRIRAVPVAVPGGAVALTPEPELAGGDRHADLRLLRPGWLVAVRERHRVSGEPVASLVAVPADGSGAVRVLVEGADFYAAPRPSPDGATLAWLQWRHPDMPWDGTELWVADVVEGDDGDDGPLLRDARRVAGGRDEALVQPEWSCDGVLHVVSDRNGWWNLHRVDALADATPALVPVIAGHFDIGLPMWAFGQSRYALLADGDVVCAASGENGDVVRRFDAQGRMLFEHTAHTEVLAVVAMGDAIAVLGARPDREAEIVRIDRDASTVVLVAARDLGLDAAFTPAPERIEFATGDGETARAWYYRPAHPGFVGAAGERPPLVVMAHSGPTGAARNRLNLVMRYWTSRGLAVVDVDYRGSTGYGRAYRRALDGRWGIADVDDCVAAVRALAGRGEVDAGRVVIRGSSAGGFTVLCALTSHPGVFAAGASHYGVADLEALALDTHKFESRYLDRLVGPYPEARDVYVARSPVHHTDRLATPMILLQGNDDRVVPPEQTEAMAAALAAKGVPHAVLRFEGEGHGFRQAATIVRALEAEASFYAQVLGFTLADPVEPVTIVPPPAGRGTRVRQ